MKAFITFCLILFSGLTFAQDRTLFQKRFLVQDKDTLYYRVMLPKDYDPVKKYPVVFFLHGAGERGNDNERQLAHGSKLFLNEQNRQNFPAIVIFPQCSINSYWSNVLRLHDSSVRKFYFLPDGEPTIAMNLLVQLVKYTLKNDQSIDLDRVYVGGLSMGGMGTFELVRRMPKTFAAAFPICGGASPATAPKIKNTEWWIFHGLKDDIVDPEFSKAMQMALKNAGAKAKLTLYPNANHNSWDATFSEPELLPWLFSKSK